jgi:hypothetical protein
VKVFVIMLGTLFLVLIFAGIILYFCKWGSLGVARFLDTLYLKIL